MIVYLVWQHEQYEGSWLVGIYDTLSAANREAETMTLAEEYPDTVFYKVEEGWVHHG